jgi:ATP-dependent Lon protease
MAKSRIYPVLPLRDIVVYPKMAAPLFVGREKSVRALDEVMRKDKRILLAAQMDASEDEPSTDRIFSVGTVATVVQLLKLPDGTVRVLVEGDHRARITNFHENETFFEAEAEELPDENADTAEARAVARAVADQWENFTKLSRKTPAEVQQAITQITEPSRLADSVAAHLGVKIPDKQALLELADVPQRLERILSLIEGEVGMLQVERKIRNRVKRQMEKTQREYYLNEQMKAIQRELGDGDEGREDIAELENRIKNTKLSKEARRRS